MKNSKYPFLLLPFLFAYQLQAQFSLGIKGGHTDAWAEYGDIGLPENAKIDVNGFNLSALAYIKINKYFQIGIEPGYTQRGAACFPGLERGIFPVLGVKAKLLLHYVELPVILSGHLPFYKNKFEFFAKIGGGTALLVKVIEEKINTQSGNPLTRIKLNLNNSFSILNRWDFGVHSGVGLAYNAGVNQIFISSDFYKGFHDAEKSNQSENRSIDFSVGYLIRL